MSASSASMLEPRAAVPKVRKRASDAEREKGWLRMRMERKKNRMRGERVDRGLRLTHGRSWAGEKHSTRTPVLLAAAFLSM